MLGLLSNLESEEPEKFGKVGSAALGMYVISQVPRPTLRSDF